MQNQKSKIPVQSARGQIYGASKNQKYLPRPRLPDGQGQAGKSKIKNFFQFGFTLLELLVVISIIGVLVVMGTFSYSTAQKKARDAERKGDLRGIGQALEQYYSVCGNVYPALSGNLTGSINCSSPAINIMPTIPLDPKTTPYVCSGTCDTTKYKICSNTMEVGPTGYCISNQQ